MEVEKRMVLMPRNTYTHNSLTSATMAGGRVSETHQRQQQQPLKCPRCDSSNTKFCYYNNYSLSQPRHFCKACKRYWTRGGTLRNVPVGGVCRKNKRVKRSSSSSASSTVAEGAMISKPPFIPLNISDLSIPLSSSTSIDHHPIFYGLQQRNRSGDNDMNSIGLCFPYNQDLSFSTLQFHPEDSTPSTSLLHDYSLIGSSLSSILQQQRLMDHDDIQAMEMAGGANLGGFKEVKDDDGRSTTTTINGLNHININGLDWQINSQLENFGSLEGNSLYWNFNSAGNPNR